MATHNDVTLIPTHVLLADSRPTELRARNIMHDSEYSLGQQPVSKEKD